jgi:hypothetical protein
MPTRGTGTESGHHGLPLLNRLLIFEANATSARLQKVITVFAYRWTSDLVACSAESPWAILFRLSMSSLTRRYMRPLVVAERVMCSKMSGIPQYAKYRFNAVGLGDFIQVNSLSGLIEPLWPSIRSHASSFTNVES